MISKKGIGCTVAKKSIILSRSLVKFSKKISIGYSYILIALPANPEVPYGFKVRNTNTGFEPGIIRLQLV